MTIRFSRDHGKSGFLVAQCGAGRMAVPAIPAMIHITRLERILMMNRNRTIKSYTMQLDGNPDDIFPLLCPVREYEWIEPWQCEMVYTDSGRAELDCIFKTNFPGDGPEDTWVVSRYEPPRCIEFVRVNAIRSIRYRIEITPQGDKSSQALWKQVITGLNPQGDDFVKGCRDEAYYEEMGILQNMLNHFLKTGEMMAFVK